MKSGTTVFAHRGLNRVAPENTLAAFRRAAGSGVRWIETDIDILADGTPVVIHDTLVDRTTDHSGSIYELTVEDLPSISNGAWFSEEFAAERIPTLSELVGLANEVGLDMNIELKTNQQGKERSLLLIDGLIEALQDLSSEREVLISSFSPLLLAELDRRDTGLRLAWLCTPAMMGQEWRSTLEMCGCQVVHPDYHGLTRARVQDLREAGYDVNAWTVNDLGLANELVNWGCTGIITDIADQMA
ncbi:MAG: glycerophosphoryl diester phosphodiesterase [Actinomyces sp.]|nr:glycerophosphoryl diester phosphodiesterase [Actinomyces sp.]MDN6429016.1 glycerophosphoryl diester phosphodiesterase [Propionibacterium sp.]MDN6565668.1 glycerophosphoryl diester phosphodiesterase [Actinomyces sp.]MDN6794638.1 glycerophosphoryl diester phosphodiesterase [Propionibacterium sp.]